MYAVSYYKIDWWSITILIETRTQFLQMETSSMEIHRKLSKIIDYQTHHRLREASNRNRAENLNQTVFWWCLTETCVIVITMLGQVFIVKNFFSDNRPHQRLNRY
jgi:protein ERP2